jgi:hypothetical protein
MSTNTTFGTGNVISNNAANSLAAGDRNTIENGNANMCLGGLNTIKDGDRNVCLGSRNLIDVKKTDFSGFGNQCNGQANRIFSINNDPINLGNEVRGIGNTILDGQAMDVCGFRNGVIRGFNSNIEGNSNRLVTGSLVHMEGFFNRVEGNPSNPITQDLSQIHVEGFDNKVVFVGDGRSGVNMTGQSGYFLFDKKKTEAEDTYNYSNQLAGGGGPTESEFLGEGISMIDRTIINGLYPVGKHQSYLNTSDGLNYAIMMKSNIELKTGTFVTLAHDKCNKCDKTNKTSNERVLVPAKNNDEVIGVITQAAGFIANAGQFAASERIEYDEYHYPIIKLNIATIENLKSYNSMKIPMKMVLNSEETEDKEEINIDLEKSEVKVGELLLPAFLTVPLSDIDRSVPFVPFDERPNYYQVALLGTVIVNANFKKRDRHHLKCDVKDGVAVPGSKYFIIRFIDKSHLEILLK